MNVIKCIVCKIVLSEFVTEPLCDKLACRESIEHRQKLEERIELFKDFWKDKTPNEENYETYLKLVDLENLYISETIVGEQPPKYSRRTWFTVNVIYSHHNWPDEFGRLRLENND